jgi:hypothetical protein
MEPLPSLGDVFLRGLITNFIYAYAIARWLCYYDATEAYYRAYESSRRFDYQMASLWKDQATGAARLVISLTTTCILIATVLVPLLVVIGPILVLWMIIARLMP